MAFELEKVEEGLNAIGLDLMMVSTDNLVEVSDVLGKIETLPEMFAPLESELPTQALDALKEGLEALIRGQIADASKAITLVGDGLTMLSDMARTLPTGAPYKGDVEAFVNSFKALVTSEGLLAEDDDSAPTAPTAQMSSAPMHFDDETPQSVGIGTPLPDWTLSVERFKTEFSAALEEIQVLLVTVEQKSDPLAALTSLKDKLRTVLGAASLLQMEDMAILAASAADLIDAVTSEHVAYSTAVTDILLKSCGYLVKGLGDFKLGPDGRSWFISPEAYSEDELNGFLEVLWLAGQGIMPAPAPEAASSAGAAGASGQKKIGEILVEKGLISEGDLGGLIEAQQNARKATLGDILVAEKYITQEDLAEALEEQKKAPNKKIGEILVALGKLDNEQIDMAMKNQEEKRETKLGEFLVKSKIGAPDKVALALREQKQGGGAAAHHITAQTVKVETKKLDGLIDLVGELVIAQSLITSNEQISSLKEQKVNKDLAQVSRITSELQRNAMSLRMVQINQTFQKMNRLVRDLSNKFEKDVRFETVGSDTEVDRNMVESIYDPLVHMVRNAMDHGLEGPAERQEHGKAAQGVLTLKAYHQGGNVVIELNDDGRGLNKEKVLQKAIDNGLVTPGEILSDAAIHALVFQPGFSTAEKISEVSGRGVGMDVVKQSIEKLRGKVDFTSEPGQGSTMTIRLPLTLAIIDGMIVRVGEHRYILPTISIIESFRPEEADYFTVKNQGEMIRVRNRLLPLMRLDRIVGAHGALSDPNEALVVVIENEGEPRCLMVDEVLGKQEVVIKSLGERLKQVRALAGGTILGDGRVGLILDVGGLFETVGVGGAVSFGADGGGGGDWDMEGGDWGAGM